MTDIRIAARGDHFAEAVTYDFLLTPLGDFDTSQELTTAATVALLTDGLARTDDELPDVNNDDRRGWWGDLDAEEIWDGWPIGSRLWLMARASITSAQARQGATTARIEAIIRDALNPFLERKIASDLDVDVTREGLETIRALIVLRRGPRDAIALRFADLWNGILVSAPAGFD